MSIEEWDKDYIHEWFGLTYSSYIVLPRSVLQSLPWRLQKQLVDALRAIEDHLSPAGFPVGGEYAVMLRAPDGKYAHDPLCTYDRGRRHVGKDDLLRIAATMKACDDGTFDAAIAASLAAIRAREEAAMNEATP